MLSHERRITFVTALFLSVFISSCYEDPYCGDGICQTDEIGICAIDCERVSANCGDNICQGSEMTTCPADCMSDGYCGDGYCDPSRERVATCATDCAPSGYCGDGYCDPATETASCSDCASVMGYCGDGICQFNENCSSDCQVSDCWAQNQAPNSDLELFTGANYMQQSCTQWCWSACMTMLAGYFNSFASQCTLMSYKAGFPDLNTCCNYAACSYQPCNTPAQTSEITYLIQQTFNLNVQFISSAISEQALINEIANRRPVEIGYQSSFAGHVVLVTGMQYHGPGQYTYTVMDPYYGIQQYVSYQQLLYGYMGGGQSWVWGMTWYRIAPTQGNCPL